MLGLGSYEYFEDENVALVRHGPCGANILDVGCGSGLFGARMRTQDNTVWGIDSADAIAGLAQRRLDRFICADAGDFARVAELLGDKRFDVIVFADVLEHLPDPVGILRSYLRFLTPGGTVLVSVPNIAVWNVRAGLMLGRFEYKATGTLDRTHLRFFTRSSLVSVLREVGLEVETIDINPGIARAFAGSAKRFVPASRRGDRAALMDTIAYRAYRRLVHPLEYRVARLIPGLLAFQYVAVARAVDRDRWAR
jgi:2-polyprenyl-3-methyl-5-hydroxy-6-metoxy-1,4-benzoquinol methylase